jgi:hypothetical protein
MPKKQIIQHKSKIRFAASLINDTNCIIFTNYIFDQWFNKIAQMINLFEFAVAVLIEFSIIGENM